MKRFGTYALLTIALVGAMAAFWHASHNHFVPFEHLPTVDATVLSVDFDAMRKAGLLSLFAAQGTEEPEYTSFIRATGFDYQKDLASVWVSFAPQVTYLIARGRFDWKRLEAYAKENGGGCYEKLCHLPGSTPQRRISFLPLQNDIMAMAVGTDDFAATRLRDRSPEARLSTPSDPVWISVPAPALKRGAQLSPGTRVFASAISSADRITLTLGTQGAEYAAKLEAICLSAKEAQAMAAQLSKITSGLRSIPTNVSTQTELTGLLLAGTFQQSDRKVFGYWPIRKALLQNLAGGI